MSWSIFVESIKFGDEKKKQHYCNFNIGNNIENVQSNDVLSAGKNLPKMWMSQKAISEKRCKDQISVVAQKPL